jgi:hypothetical protein
VHKHVNAIAQLRRPAEWCIAPGDTPRSSIGWRYLRTVTGINGASHRDTALRNTEAGIATDAVL